MEAAPFHSDLAEGPEGGEATWLSTEDGVRIRAVLWKGGAAGTVFVFPAAVNMPRNTAGPRVRSPGEAMRCLRSTGAARVLGPAPARPRNRHVRRFTDYQFDVRALLAHAEARGLPQPWLLLAHSMGGCIGLRSLIDGVPFIAAGFSAPMWGVRIAPKLEAAAHILPIVATRIGLGGTRTPTTGRPSYLIEAPFEGNLLTTDPDMWDYMVRQAAAEERFRLGGPSLMWLGEALAETRALLRAPRPNTPAHASVGTLEKIVVADTVETIMKDWRAAASPGSRGPSTSF